MSHILGTHHTMATGVSPGVTPAASLTPGARGLKLRLDLGAQTLLIALGSDPRQALTAMRDDLTRLLKEASDAA